MGHIPRQSGSPPPLFRGVPLAGAAGRCEVFARVIAMLIPPQTKIRLIIVRLHTRRASVDFRSQLNVTFSGSAGKLIPRPGKGESDSACFPASVRPLS